MKWIIALLILIVFSCTNSVKKADDSSGEIKTDTMDVIRNFICGLWSMDTGNALSNEGYYFMNDGTVNFIASDASGSWELKTKDSLSIDLFNLNRKVSLPFKIDSLSESRMVLNDSEGTHLFRKVPFGMNPDAVVLQGFAGKLDPGNEKEYLFDVTAVKKIGLKLKSENKSIAFNIYDGENQLTPVALQEWNAIIIRSGKYRVVVTYPKSPGAKNEVDFDLKVLGY